MGVSVRTPELEDALVEGLTNGIPLRELCRNHGVSKSAVYDWIDGDAVFAGRIAQARARGFDEIAEEALEIADDATNDWTKRNRDDGSTEDVMNHEHVQRSKLRIETRLKLLAKWDPKRYGDKTLIGSDPDNPLPDGFKVSFVGASKPDA
ncbi:terminase small subunit protein [Novosphingobium sp. M1R2S20]|uniref:Terminase small subunit protein n=1 Tax=Novosphingobium rhizovicinum TaxID=3228928 RepID=A0ABV3RCV7_9SPHN